MRLRYNKKSSTVDLGLVRPADEVVKGNAEEVGEGNDSIQFWLHRSIFKSLQGDGGNANSICNCLLGNVALKPKRFETFI